MKIKSSNKRDYLFLGILVIAALLLFAFKLNYTVKPSKYPVTPKLLPKWTITNLDLIQITMNEKSYKKLQKKKDKALALGILEANNNDYVPVTINYQNKDYRAELRLKGDWTDHFKDDKWSFRIKLKDDQTIMGMRKFSLHRPGARGFINEWLYQKVVKDEQLIGLRYDFLEGVIHIKKPNSSQFDTKSVGVYAIEESFDKRTIESNRRKESVILKYSEDAFWNRVKQGKLIGNPSGVHWKKTAIYKDDFPITVFGEDKVIGNPTLKKYFTLGKELLEKSRKNKMTIDEAFDTKELALQNALLNLFGATHGLYNINVRYYYNPITSKLEPIAFDGNSGQTLKEYHHLDYFNKKTDSIYFKELTLAMEKVSKPEYLDEIVDKYSKDLDFYKKELKKEYKNWPTLKLESFKDNQRVIRKELFEFKNGFKSIVEDSAVKTKEFKKKAIPEKDAWNLVNTNLAKKENEIYTISRLKTEKPAYVFINGLNVDSSSLYKVRILAKKSEQGTLFGLRIQSKHQNRVDAVFDLKNGTLKGVIKSGNYMFENASINTLENGWFELTVEAKVSSDKVHLVFGPTNGENWNSRWEWGIKKNVEAIVDLSSLELSEIAN